MITLLCNDLALRLNPGVGGSVDSFLRGNTPILRSTKPGSTNALDQAAYPLIPFSGRIDQGRFSFNGRAVQLPSNMPPEPHAIHGQGWQSEWQLVSHSKNAATIELSYTGAEWPWRYRATQTFELSDNALTLVMSLQNLSESLMPAGLGWHPFFPKEDATLTADVALIWPSGDNMISQPPEQGIEVEQLKAGASVGELNLDNAFNTTTQQAQMQWSGQSLAITLHASPGLSHLVIYTPPTENFFCVEPVSHAPNCLNSSLPANVTGAKTLTANETMHAIIRLELA